MASHPTPARAEWRATIGWGAVLVLTTLAVYWPALRGGILIDDLDHITRSEWRSWHGLFRIWFEVGITSQYFPLLHSAFWIEHRLWGDALLGYHLVNVLQHAASACLLVALLRRLALPGAWIAGFVFALHPVAVESVAWISEQKNTLSTLVFLGAAYVYLDFDRTRRRGSYAIAFVLFALALLTKSSTATLVPALLVVFWWQRGRLDWRRDVLPLVPWFACGAALGLFTAWYERVYANARGASFDLGFVERTLIAGRAVIFYARSWLGPLDLQFINERWTPDATAAVQYLFPASVVGVGLALAWRASRARGPLTIFLLYVGTLAPTLGFLNINWFNYSFVADHFQYLPSLALAAGAGWALARFLHPSRVNGTVTAAVVVLALATLSWRQSRHYRDGETLYRWILAENPRAWIAHHNLGALLLERPGGTEEAIVHLRAVLELKPNHLRAHNNLGYAYSRLPGRLPEAIQEFEASLRLDPDDAKVTLFLAHALAQTPGRRDDAIAAYRRALQLAPATWEAHVGLGQQLAASPAGLDEAIAEFQAAIRLEPTRATLFMDLGVYLVRASRRDEALAAFREAARLAPKWEPPRKAIEQLGAR